MKYPYGPRKPMGKVWCRECQKYGWHTRKDAKKAEKNYPEEHMRPYQCPVDKAFWHIGHLPDAVRQGDMSAEEWYGGSPELGNSSA